MEFQPAFTITYTPSGLQYSIEYPGLHCYVDKDYSLSGADCIVKACHEAVAEWREKGVLQGSLWDQDPLVVKTNTGYMAVFPHPDRGVKHNPHA